MSDLTSQSPVNQKAAETGSGIAVGDFVGALVGETARARAISDLASVQIAERYLHHELLRGFTVPRMQIRDLEIDLNFAVASKSSAGSFLEDEEIQRNISHRIREFLGGLPGVRGFRLYFGNDAKLAARWAGGLEEMTRRFRHILSRPGADCASAISGLSLSVQNHFYESASGGLRSNVSSLLARPIGKAGAAGSMRAVIEREIESIVMSVAKRGPGGSPESAPGVEILVGAAQLEKLNPASLSKMKLTLSPSDRRWVATDQDGKKVYILGT